MVDKNGQFKKENTGRKANIEERKTPEKSWPMTIKDIEFII